MVNLRKARIGSTRAKIHLEDINPVSNTNGELGMILDPENVVEAARYVRTKLPASQKNLTSRIWQNLPNIAYSLLSGKYRPGPFVARKIEKLDGSLREIHEPSVQDRIIQRAIYQWVAWKLDSYFDQLRVCPLVHGWRPGHGNHTALDMMKIIAIHGRFHAVLADVGSAFDGINPDGAIDLFEKHFGFSDKRVVDLVRQYLRPLIKYPDGTVRQMKTGIPQGGGLSPLLCNIILGQVDGMLVKQGHLFVRYGDNYCLLAGSHKASVGAYGCLVHSLKKVGLQLNAEKTLFSPVSGPEFNFLGFRLSEDLQNFQVASSATSRWLKKNRLILAGENDIARRRKITGFRNYYRNCNNLEAKIAKIERCIKACCNGKVLVEP